MVKGGAGLRNGGELFELDVWEVFERGPVTTPFESGDRAGEGAEFVVLGAGAEVAAVGGGEYAEVESEAEVVPGVAGAGVGDAGAGFGAALGVDGVLLRIGACAADDFYLHSEFFGQRESELHPLSGGSLSCGDECGDVLFRA